METSFIVANGIILGLTEVIKRAGLSSKYAPLLAVFIGLIYAFLTQGLSVESLTLGIVAALTAMGLYSGTKSTIKG